MVIPTNDRIRIGHGSFEAKVRNLAKKIARYHGKIARYHGKIYGNISLNNGISWGLAAPRPPHGFPRVLGAWEGPKNNF